MSRISALFSNIEPPSNGNNKTGKGVKEVEAGDGGQGHGQRENNKAE